MESIKRRERDEKKLEKSNNLFVNLCYVEIERCSCRRDVSNLQKEIQTHIESFIPRIRSHWISMERIQMEPDKGGLGAINLEAYATSLRCSWLPAAGIKG